MLELVQTPTTPLLQKLELVQTPQNSAQTTMLTHWQMYQIVTSSKVLGRSSVEFTETLFVLTLMQIQFFKQGIRNIK